MLSSLSVNLALRLAPAEEGLPERLAVVQVPSGLPRLVRVSGGDGVTFVVLDDVIRAGLDSLFPGQAVLESAAFRLTRDSELELDDEGGQSYVEALEEELRRRRKSDVVRLEIDGSASDVLASLLVDLAGVAEDDLYRVPGFLDLHALWGIVDLPGFEALRDSGMKPVPVLGEGAAGRIFDVLDAGDILVHHPYEGFEPVLALVEQAADDPDVLAIKQTLYRAGADSPVVAALMRAADRGKQVTVVVELMARFDEERNLRWARALEEAGAHVIYGIRGLKVHAKCCLVVRRTPLGLRRYVHVGTGNYNHRTARLYTDVGLLTSSPEFGVDASAFFNALTGYSDPPRMKKLVMAPSQLRDRLLRLVERETRRAQDGQPALIRAKMNALVDERDGRGALPRLGGRRARAAERARHLRAEAGREGPQREHRGRVDRRPVPRARAHLPLPERRRGRGVPRQRRLDAAQSGPPGRADVAGRGPGLPAPPAAHARRAVPRQREGAAPRRRRHVARAAAARGRRPACRPGSALRSCPPGLGTPPDRGAHRARAD